MVEAILALWSAVQGCFTPTVFFVLLNIVIGTIAVTSKVAPSAAAAAEEEGGAAAGAGAGGDNQRRLSRVPSMAFERLRSFNLSRLAAPLPEPAVAGVVDLGYEQTPSPAMEKEEEEEPMGLPELEVEPELEPVPEPEPEKEHAHAAHHMERSRSEAAASAEQPRLPARLLKSASDRSAFAHIEAEEVEEAVRAVEARRPATTREGARRGGRRVPVAEPDSSDSEPEAEEEAAAAGGEVDARADAFINKFHHQLKLQRIESFIRHRETVRRGQAAAAGV